MFTHLQPNIGLSKSAAPVGLNQPALGGTPMIGGLPPGLTFSDLLAQQLQAAGLSPGAFGSAAPGTAFVAIPVGQIASAGGHGLPTAGSMQPLTIETFSYSRISFLPMTGAETHDKELASLLQGLEAPANAAEAEIDADLATAAEIPPVAPGLPESAHPPLDNGRAEAAALAALAPMDELIADPQDSVTKVTAPVDIPPINLADLGAKIGEKVVNLAEQDVPRVQAAIDHPEFGHIAAAVKIQDGEVTLSFATDNAQVKAALASAEDEIEAILAESGLVLAGMQITGSADSPTLPGIFTPAGNPQLAASHLDNLLLESLGGGPLNLIQA